MDRATFRNKVMELMELANKINENVEFTEVIVSIETYKKFDSATVNIRQYEENIHFRIMHDIEGFKLDEERKLLEEMLSEVEIYD